MTENVSHRYLYLLTIVWPYTAEALHGIDLFVLTSNVVALQAFLNCRVGVSAAIVLLVSDSQNLHILGLNECSKHAALNCFFVLRILALDVRCCLGHRILSYCCPPWPNVDRGS